MARTPRILHLLLTLCILSSSSISISSAPSATDAFLGCLAAAGIPPRLLHTPASPSYAALLLSSVRNLRYVAPGTTRPLAIVAAAKPAHAQAAVRCGRCHGVRVRVRSGGHDYEGLSYASLDRRERFAVLDLGALRDVRIDAARAESWAGSGATLGELYYAVGAASRALAFPAGVCPTVGVGGHLSGGGFGSLMRRNGLAADNVLDALIVDADGRLLNRTTMGEDLFWAIRGGGGESFGVVLSWKLRLVSVPETVTVFTVRRSRNQSATDLITKWQEIAPALPWDLILRVVVQNQHAQFEALFLGRCSRLLRLMRAHFPDLGVTQPDCEEISWIQSTVYFAFSSSSKPLELLLDRGEPDRYVKAKSDYVQEPIPRHVWERTWSWLEKPEAGLLILDPYGGRMGSISPSATPFPHRKGNLYNLQYYSFWFENGTSALEKRMSWVRGLYEEMEPFVSKNPRTGYVNYRDLDLGTNEMEGNVTSYAKARVWGEKYFKGNFERLAAVKAMVDPDDFFRNEQSIPPHPAAKGWSSD
ncbi:berberine bridge enzyme-like Cyn d 4 [Phragmites australis]|uniref:berberine bridge enzyme-like Cyn d 4 n=1 Tax=Phragmites australis TaxID=29695 RepID=UPI002D78E8E3|nr:berberine bridge enzyme-like Cyn d 4 [Phragmites australis]